MRTISIFCNFIVFLLFTGLSIHPVAAQTVKTEKVYDITPLGSLHITSGRSNIEILTWDRNEVKVVSELTFKGIGNKEDVNKLFDAFKNMNSESSKNVLKLNQNLIVSVSSTGKLKKVETKLYNGDKISIDANNNNIKIVHTIWIPASLGNMNLILYNCEVNVADPNNATIDVSARFSTIRIENSAGKAKFDFYNSKLFGKNFQTFEISARFSEISIADISEPKINSSYKNKFSFATVNTFICQQSKFDTFKFDEIVVDASFPDAYNTNVDIQGTSTSFRGFSGNFRFGSVNLKLNPNIAYNLNYSGSHGHLDVSPDRFKTRFISDKSSTKTTVQGSTTGAKCDIVLVTYNTTFKIE